MKMKLFLCLLVLVLGLSVFPKLAYADEVVLPPTDDTFIDQNEPSYTFGHSSSLWATAKPNENRIILLKFSLSGIPKDSTIQSANLSMRANTCGGLDETPTMLLSYSNDDWSEETVRWTGRPRIGLDIDVIDAYPRTKLFDMTTPVSKWVKGTTANYGVILTIQGGPYECEFRSIERDPDDVQLIVQYQPPAKTLSLTNVGFKAPVFTLQDVSSGSGQSSPSATPAALPSSNPEVLLTTTPEDELPSEKSPEAQGNIVITPQQVIIGLVSLVALLLIALAAVMIRKKKTEVKDIEVDDDETESKEDK